MDFDGYARSLRNEGCEVVGLLPVMMRSNLERRRSARFECMVENQLRAAVEVMVAYQDVHDAVIAHAWDVPIGQWEKFESRSAEIFPCDGGVVVTWGVKAELRARWMDRLDQIRETRFDNEVFYLFDVGVSLANCRDSFRLHAGRSRHNLMAWEIAYSIPDRQPFGYPERIIAGRPVWRFPIGGETPKMAADNFWGGCY